MTPALALIALAAPFTAASSTEPLVLAPTTAPAAVAAEGNLPDFSYTFLEANAVFYDFDDVDEDLYGWQGKASIELPLNLFVQGSYTRVSDDTDVDLYRLGAGIHIELADPLDIYGIVSWGFQEVDGGGIDEDDDGATVEAGARFLLSEWVEINGKAEWQDLDDEDDLGFGAGARFYVTNNISLGGEVEWLDSDLLATAGVRLQF